MLQAPPQARGKNLDAPITEILDAHLEHDSALRMDGLNMGTSWSSTMEGSKEVKDMFEHLEDNFKVIDGNTAIYITFDLKLLKAR